MEIRESAKDYGDRRTFPTYRTDLAGLNQALLAGGRNREMIRQATQDYQDLKSERATVMANHLSSYMEGRISAGQLARRLKGELASAHRDAFALGMRAAGYTGDMESQDDAWLQNARRYEWGFMNDFMEDLVHNRTVMPPERRLQMYADTIDAFWWHGQVEGQGPDTVIHWNLSHAEHCATCIDLASESPYTADTLPTTPRAGYSECLSNCKCYLTFETATGEPIPSDEEIPEPSTGILGYVAQPQEIPEGMRLPDPAEQAIIDARLLQAAFYREAAFQATGDELRAMLARRDETIDALNSFMQENKLVMADNSLLDAAVLGRPPSDAIRSDIFERARSISSLQYLGRGLDPIIEQLDSCVGGKTI